MATTSTSGLREAGNDPGRIESEQEREDRNLIELLQELRVASVGVQVLFGYLLALPFTVRFTKLSIPQRNLYVGILVLTAIAVAQLTAPVAYHRLVFRQHKKGRLLRAANGMAITGLATLGVAICGAVLLACSVVLKGPVVPLLVACTASVFVTLWLVAPVVGRRARSNEG